MTTLNEALEAQPALQALTVRGEIANYKRSSKGHLYFTLKDDQSEITCVMFHTAAMYLRFPPSSGLQVVLQGGVELYGTRGQLQLRVRKMQPDGPGALRLKLEELRKKLDAEGLFEPDRKRALAVLPARVGVVTSREGSVLHDIAVTLKRRNPGVQLIVSPAPVQGADAPGRLIRALERVVAFGVDCVIIARGGGSLEDLMAFNDEELVRAVAACPVPIVSAIGHQTDVTLCDMAADRRAPTPTAAAELVAADRADLKHALDVSRTRLQRALQRQLQSHRERLERLQGSPCLRYPERLLAGARASLRMLQTDLERFPKRLKLDRARLEELTSRLQARHGLGQRERLELRALTANLARYPARLQRERDRLEELSSRLQIRHPRLATERERLRLGELTARLRSRLPEKEVLRERSRLGELEARLLHPIRQLGQRERRTVQELLGRLKPALLRSMSPRHTVIGALRERLRPALERSLERRRQRLGALAGQLDALSPLKVLERGYAYTRDADGRVVTSVLGRQPGDALKLYLADGVLGVRVDSVQASGDVRADET